ncbi:MAG: hypothetical protein EOM24_25265 [Chloroflexia bacterium]|nr:hypothetical protein [Chloroflexia bacterium]
MRSRNRRIVINQPKKEGIKKMKKNIMIIAALVAVAASVAQAQLLQSKYDADVDGASTATKVDFAPASGPLVVKSIIAKSGTATADLALYARNGSPSTLAVDATNAQEIVYFPGFTSNQYVVVSYGNGNVSWHELSAVTASNVTLASGLTEAATAGKAKLYGMTQQGSIYIANTAFNEAGDALFVTPADSPLRVACSGVTNNYLTVTVQK